jgi:hypothetical protein
VLVRDPQGRCEPLALLSTDLELEARQILLYYLRRWSMEVTFQAARLHLGIDGQRQWHDLAVARTTPTRLGLFSLVTLMVQRQPAWQGLFRHSAWQKKARPTFDALAHVRRALWRQLGFWLSELAGDAQTPPAFMRARGGTARLPHLKMAKAELKSLAKLNRPSGTKATPSSWPLTKWQWGLPWAKFSWPVGPSDGLRATRTGNSPQTLKRRTAINCPSGAKTGSPYVQTGVNG